MSAVSSTTNSNSNMDNGKNENMSSYQVVQTLGEGAFGEVLLIVDRSDPNCAVAMKKMAVSSGDKEIIGRIRKEALLQRMLSKVGHENVVRLIGMRNDTDNYYLYLEYADGGELFDKIEPDVGMPPSRAQFYFRQIICGLEYIHGLGVVHRDIKPENLLLTSSHILKISDFGLATVFRHEGRERYLDISCGTPPYTAPEVISDEKYKAEPIDIWSAGIVLVTMLTGELPWERADDSSLSYLNWISNTNLDENPWKKIDVRGLSFLRIIVTNNVANRATIERIKKHPWYTHNYGCVAYNGNPIKRRQFEEIENIPSTQIEPVYLAKRRHIESGAFDALSEKKRNLEKKNSSFSQPTNMDDMLLTQNIDMSQGSNNPLQRMVCRMTRFCVNVNIAVAIQRIATECEYAGFLVRQKSPVQLLVTYRELSIMVTAYSMFYDNSGIKVMIDFRRSRGDGIQFKRMFVELRSRMHDLICNDGNMWLENCGLTPPEP